MNLLACNILEKLKEMNPGSEVAVCGGYARDVFFGRKPKDIDIFVHLGPYADEACAFYDAEEICIYARSLGFHAGVSQAYGISAMPGEEVTFNERHYSIAQLDLGELSIDVLFTRADTIDETLAKFDANINQVYLDELGGPQWLAGNPPTTLRFLKALTPERRAHVIRLAKELRVHEG